eukprot:1221404-Pleurochrysis_carterae.AAC.1
MLCQAREASRTQSGKRGSEACVDALLHSCSFGGLSLHAKTCLVMPVADYLDCFVPQMESLEDKIRQLK